VAKHDTTSTLILWTSLYSELAQSKQPKITANVLLWTEFAQKISKKKKRFRTTVSMDMKYEF